MAVVITAVVCLAFEAGAVTLVWPVPGHTKLSQSWHDGNAIDISDGSITGATVVAAMGGKVTHIRNCTINHYGSMHDCNGFGTGVVIEGYDGRIYQYAHMLGNSIPSNVYVGAYVSAGDKIGAVGNTGNSTGAHLHFGISVGNYWNDSGINPSNESYIYSNDTEKPVITNVKISNVSSTGYTVTCNASDNLQISHVAFGTWTDYNHQDDLLWKDGTINGNIVTCRVDISEHNYERGGYTTHIYAYDDVGNNSSTGINVIVPDEDDVEQPTISNIKILDVSSTGYTVTCDVSDNLQISYVAFATWTDFNHQDDILWKEGTINGNTVTFRANISEHNNENGGYTTHIYAYDTSGNYYAKGISVNVPADDIISYDDSVSVNNKHYVDTEKLMFKGWAFSNKSKEVSFKYVLDSNAPVLVKNVNRDDVKKIHSNICSFENVGYSFEIDLSKLSVGKHNIKIIATSSSGTTKTVSDLCFYVNAHLHVYANSCDVTCNVCSATRSINHTYTNSCDISCNICKATRKITHSYKTTTTKATLKKNGKQVTKCTVCGDIKSSKTIYYPKSVKLSTSTYTYNGKTKTPTVVVKDSKGNTLKKDTDYTVKYASGRKNPGKYTVTVTFKGKYSGTKKLTLTIKPKAPSITDIYSKTKGRAVIKWNNVAGESGYQLYYSTSKNGTYKKVKSYEANKLAGSKTKLKSGKTYCFKVRAYKKTSSGTVYSSWSAVKSVKVK